MSLSTSDGDVSVGDVEGRLSVHTSGGHVEVGRVNGSMELRTSGGQMQVAGCSGDAVVHTSGGDILLKTMGGYVKASTSGGNVSVDIAPGNASGADVSSSKGSITLRIPPGVGFELNAVATDSRVVADVPGLRSEPPSGKESLSATIGGGGNLLRLHTKHDTIRIVEGESI